MVGGGNNACKQGGGFLGIDFWLVGKSEEETGNHFGNRAHGGVVPFVFANTARDGSRNANGRGIVDDAAVLAEGGI